MSLLLMAANVQFRDEKLGFSDTATDVQALHIKPNDKTLKRCHVKVLNIGDTSNQASNNASSLFKDARGKVNGLWNVIESHSKDIKVNTV